MKPFHRLIRRAGIYYAFETATNKRESLGTRDKTETTQLFAAKMQSILQPVLNLRMAKVYLAILEVLSCGLTGLNLKLLVMPRCQRRSLSHECGKVLGFFGQIDYTGF